MVNEHAGRRERKKSEVRDRIITSALKVFLQKGFNETTIAEIMADADLGTGTFYNYFQSKEDIIIYCVSEKVSEAKVMIEEIKEKPLRPLDKIAEILLTVGEVFEENRHIMGLFMQLRRTGNNAELPPHNNIFRDIIVNVFQQGQEECEFRPDIPAETVAELIFGILQSSLTSHSTGLTYIENLKVKLSILFEGILNNKSTAGERDKVNGNKDS